MTCAICGNSVDSTYCEYRGYRMGSSSPKTAFRGVPTLATAPAYGIASRAGGPDYVFSAPGCPAPPSHSVPAARLGKTSLRYANFFLRFFALLIDEILAGTAAAVTIVIFSGFRVLLATVGVPSNNGLSVIGGMLFCVLGIPAGIAVYIAYFAMQEASAAQATLGKRVFRIRVTNLSGGTITSGQSAARLVVKSIFSVFFLGIGLILAALTERKQALHDFAAETIVTTR
jgi:uncharacterized RDD family membrane protein YckC